MQYNPIKFGKTYDASWLSTIQATINRASVDGGGLVIVPPNTTILENINLKSNVFIKGGGTSTVIKCPASTPLNVVTCDIGAVNFGISDLTLDGNKANNTSTANDDAQNGIWFYQGSYFTIKDIYSKNAIRSGIAIKGLAGAVYQMNGIIANCFTTDNETGMYLLTRAEYLSIVGLQSYSNAIGAVIKSGNNSISSSKFLHNTTEGLWMMNGDNSHSLLLDNCSICHNTGHGISYNNFSGDAGISNCSIFGNKEHNIYLLDAVGVTINGCTFGNPGDMGGTPTVRDDICIDAGILIPRKNIVNACEFVGATGRYAINEQHANSDYNIFTCNTIGTRSTGSINVQGVNSIDANNIKGVA